MFNFDTTTINNTNLFGQSTPVNQNRKTGNNYLFGNTTAIPPLTPFLSSNSFGSTTLLQPSLLDTSTFPKTESVIGLKKINKNNIQTSNKLHSEDHRKFPLSTTVTSTTSPTFTALPTVLKNNQPLTSNFTLGKSSSFLPTTTTTSNTSFTFSLPNSVITSSTTIAPTLFSTMHQPKTTPLDLQLFQTMVTTQPFNNELAFLARNIQPNVKADRNRFSTASTRPKTNLYSTILTKPSIPISSSNSNKRKFDQSILDEDDPTLYSTNQISQLNIKRPRMLDMTKIRSIILQNNEPSMIKSSSEHLLRWNQFSTYEEYLSSKKADQRAFRLPRLTHQDYYTKPTIEELQSVFNEHGQCLVKELTIGRKHYGSVTFQGLHMNLAGLDLDRLVEIDRRQVTVYPDEKNRPKEGEELNCQAIISLIGVYPIDRSKSNDGEEVTDPVRLIEMNYGKYLEGMTNKFQGHFLDYDVHTGTWRFEVEHF